jgi:cyanophycinase
MSLRLTWCAALVALAGSAVGGADGPPPPLDPRGLPGPLVLAGGGKIPAEARAAFVALAGKGKAKIVVITTGGTAANDPKRAAELVKAWEELKPASVATFHTLDPKKANDPAFVKPLAEATGVWLHNASARKLATAYRGTLVEKELKALAARGGAIGGAGGGDEALGGLLIESGAAPVAGFDLLPGFLIGNKKDIEAALVTHPAHVGLGVPDDAAVVIRGRVAQVMGDVPIAVHVAKGAGKPAADDEYRPGSLLDLVQLRRAAANRAAKDPFPTAKPADPVVAKGALVIVGGAGVGEDIWKRFIELAGGPDAPIVFVATALDNPLAGQSAEEKELTKYGARRVIVLHARDRKEADDPKFSAALTTAGGVWFSGGRQWRFVDSYEGTLTEKRFREVLARGGVIGGSSAGASIQGEYMPRGHPLGNTVMAAEGYERGFGFLPGCAVDQHFFARKRTADMTGLMKEYPQYLGIGIDEGTALVVTGGTAEVLGKSKVAFYDTRKKADGARDYEEVFPREKYDLKARKKLK